MTILEQHTLTEAQLAYLVGLMKELSPDSEPDPKKIRRAAACPATHLFAVVDDGGDCGGSDGVAREVAGGDRDGAASGGRIVGCASLCVFESPTGRKAHIEDVVISSACRGQHLGRALLEHILGYARENLTPIDVHLTSRPARVAANSLYRTLGFEQRDTNVYRLIIK